MPQRTHGLYILRVNFFRSSFLTRFELLEVSFYLLGNIPGLPCSRKSLCSSAFIVRCSILFSVLSCVG